MSYLKVLPGPGYYCFLQPFPIPRFDWLEESSDENISAKPLLVVDSMQHVLLVPKALQHDRLLTAGAFQTTAPVLDPMVQRPLLASERQTRTQEIADTVVDPAESVAWIATAADRTPVVVTGAERFETILDWLPAESAVVARETATGSSERLLNRLDWCYHR